MDRTSWISSSTTSVGVLKRSLTVMSVGNIFASVLNPNAFVTDFPCGMLPNFCSHPLKFGFEHAVIAVSSVSKDFPVFSILIFNTALSPARIGVLTHSASILIIGLEGDGLGLGAV